tara:strand:+ start:3829 stop:3975 length:147 start_codon:yes stop_codon:yes gene_type:complete
MMETIMKFLEEWYILSVICGLSSLLITGFGGYFFIRTFEAMTIEVDDD